MAVMAFVAVTAIYCTPMSHVATTPQAGASTAGDSNLANQSGGDVGVDRGCSFLSVPNDTPAFCDAFSEGPSHGGRAGELNPRWWSVSRIGGGADANDMMPFPSTPVSACRSGVAKVRPDDDILVCDRGSGHFGQIITAMRAQNYALMSMRPRRLFNFANRTGTVTFNVDAVNEGGLSWWPSIFITDRPTAAANDAGQVLGLLPRNGVGIDFDGTCNTSGSTEGGVGQVLSYRNYVETNVTSSATINHCFKTLRGSLNHIEVRVSRSHLSVWASDYSTDGGQTYPRFRRVFSVPVSLSFSQGYVFYQMGERAPVKYETLFGIDRGYASYYWSDMGFDGPRINNGERGYSVPDALTVDPNLTNGAIPLHNALNVAYGLYNHPTSIVTCCQRGTRIDHGPMKVPAVDLTGVKAAYLSFDVSFTYMPPAFTDANVLLRYRLNRGQPMHPDPRPNYAAEAACGDCPGPLGGGGVAFVFPVPVAELVTGVNTLMLLVPDSNNGYPPLVSNLDLLTFTATDPF
jgi:hypothetical protein